MPAKPAKATTRLTPVDESTNANAAAVFAKIKKTRGNVSHVLRSLGHAPEGLRAFAGYGEYVRYRTTLSGRVRELAILALARGNQYAWTHHAPFALKEGVTQEELDRLNAGTLASTLSASERAALAMGKIEAIAQTKVICLMCFERDQHTCHRKIVADHLESRLSCKANHLGVKHGAGREIEARRMRYINQGSAAQIEQVL